MRKGLGISFVLNLNSILLIACLLFSSGLEAATMTIARWRLSCVWRASPDHQTSPSYSKISSISHENLQFYDGGFVSLCYERLLSLNNWRAQPRTENLLRDVHYYLILCSFFARFHGWVQLRRRKDFFCLRDIIIMREMRCVLRNGTDRQSPISKRVKQHQRRSLVKLNKKLEVFKDSRSDKFMHIKKISLQIVYFQKLESNHTWVWVSCQSPSCGSTIFLVVGLRQRQRKLRCDMAQFHASRMKCDKSFIALDYVMRLRVVGQALPFLYSIFKDRHLHQIWHLLERWAFADQSAESQSIAPRRRHVVNSHVLVTFNHPTAPQFKSFRTSSFTHLQRKQTASVNAKWKCVKQAVFA